MKFNEDTRVKIPTILHLIRLGYRYLFLKEQAWDLETNIFPESFAGAMANINPGIEQRFYTTSLGQERRLANSVQSLG